LSLGIKDLDGGLDYRGGTILSGEGGAILIGGGGLAASMEAPDYSGNRGLDKAQLLDLRVRA